jgi:flagellum-specific peptidoglycan hydrolase FlgJ
MPDRDAQTVILSRPTILLVTGVGVGLLTLTYVLGVQVGKQSAALRQSRFRTAGEELTELPASLDEQLKLLDNREFEKARKAEETPRTESPKAEEAKAASEPKAEVKKPEPKQESPKAEAKGDQWTLQLVSTPDETEAKRVAEKAKAAGFTPTIVKEKGQFKVRLAKPGSKPEMDAAALRLKAKGQGSFPVKMP